MYDFNLFFFIFFFIYFFFFFFFFSSRRRPTRSYGDSSSDVCSSDLATAKRWWQIKFTESDARFVGTKKSRGCRASITTRMSSRSDSASSPKILRSRLSESGWKRSEERRVGKECRAGRQRYQR